MKGTAPGAELRFSIGTRVECNCGEWKAGTVVKQWYREPGWPATKQVPYQIKLDYGPTIFAPADDNQCIRKVEGLLSVGQIPVTVLTGFLGAGKTTLLNYILSAQHGKKYAVIENEFGDVAIDNQLLAVKKSESIESITVLDNGCLCCTVRDDLVGAIKDIVKIVEERYQKGTKDALLDGILIETTGMADPGPIIKTFQMDATVQKFCKIDGILTVVDCKHFLTQLHRERPKDAVNEPAQQVGFADKLLLNKIDACERALVDETTAAIRAINSFVPIRECCLGSKPDELPIDELLSIEAFDAAKMMTQQSGTDEVNLVAPPKDEGGHGGHGGGHDAGHDGHGEGHAADCDDAGHEGGGHGVGDHEGGGHGGGHGNGHGAQKPASRHDTDVRSMVLEVNGNGLNLKKFQYFLHTILEERSVDLYRYKGVLAVEEKKTTLLYILQGVHDMPELTFSGEWPEGKPIKTQIVMIGRKLDEAGYRKAFAECIIK